MVPMVTDKVKELEAARAKIASLEKSIADELNELAAVPAKYGFASAAEFAKAVTAAGQAVVPAVAPAPAAAPAKAAAPAAPAKAAAKGRKRRKRAVITSDTRASVKKMVGAGKTGSEIAKALGISLPSVQNIKKALGLVKKR